MLVTRGPRTLLPVLALLAVAHVDAPSHAAPTSIGRWVAPFSEDGDGDGRGDFDARPPRTAEESARLPAAVNLVVLPDGRVLYWSQLDGTEAVRNSIAVERPAPAGSRTRVLELGPRPGVGSASPAATWSTPLPEDAAGGDLSGSDQRHLPDGRILVAGGTEWANEDAALGLPGGAGRTELYGARAARVFDPHTAVWTRLAPMHRGRYYPSLVTLPDGALLAVGGVGKLVYNSALVPGQHPPHNAFPENVRGLERFDPGSGTWELLDQPPSRAPLPPFPRLHLWPNGKLFYPAVGTLFPPGGGDREAAAWNVQRWYDPAARTWTDAGHAPLGVRSNAFSVLLRLEPPYDRAGIVIGGGSAGPWPGGYLATALSEVVTWDARSTTPDVPTRTFGPPLTAPRWHSTAVMLPTGEVVALSGSDKDEIVAPGSGVAVRHAEAYDPATGRWTRLAAGARDRTLHNTAVLLRDGSILVGGHAPGPANYGSHRENAPLFASNFKDPSFEIFRPPYLFRGRRPVIDEVSEASRRPGESLTIRSRDADDATLQVVLSRLPAVTHGIDSDQRTVVLEHRVTGAGTVAAKIPGPAVVPPGHYYLFLLTDRGRGPTPSVAEIVRIDPAG